MSILNIDFDAAVEPTVAPAGRYRLQIVAAEVGKSSDRSKFPGNPQFKVSIGFPDDPQYQTFTHYASTPAPEMTAKELNWCVVLLRRFLSAFNVPYRSGELDLEQLSMEMVGAEWYGEVGLSEPNDDGRTFNNLRLPPVLNG